MFGVSNCDWLHVTGVDAKKERAIKSAKPIKYSLHFKNFQFIS